MQSRGDDIVLEQVCGRIAQEVGDGVTIEKLYKFKRFLNSLPSENPKSLSWSLKRIISTAVAVALCAAAFIFSEPSDKAIPFWIGPLKTVGVVGKSIVSPHYGKIAISFERGTTLELKNGSVAKVVESKETEVGVKLESGELHAKVKGNGKTKWTVDAGPFRVVVVGTEFTVSWHRDKELFDVEVEEGTVLVQGTRFTDKGLKVVKGYYLRIDQQTDFLELSAIDTSNEHSNQVHLLASNQKSSRKSEIGNQKEEEACPAPSNSNDNPKRLFPKYAVLNQEKSNLSFHKHSHHRKGRFSKKQKDLYLDHDHKNDNQNSKDKDKGIEITWIDFFDNGDYAKALIEAEKIGFDNLSSSLELNTLWKLMLAARHQGRHDVAHQVLLACRKRFSTTNKAKIASFILGKIHDEKTQNSASAVAWFSRYLKESPNGHLAEEASGRIMLLYDRQNIKGKAKHAASVYLKKYPKGLFSVRARVIERK